jgi:DNA segregation ATPase FtsK/SpoIIIE-like protein
MGELAVHEQSVQTVNSMSIIDSVDLESVKNTLAKINQFQMVIQNTLKKDHDYGVIPGTPKPTLLKPGAEKIQMLLGVTSEYEVIERVQDFEKGFFAFTVRCIIYKDGIKITEGLGHCNNREPKFYKKKSGELQDPYEKVNTVLKMAKKRAQIDATLTVASLSEIFTQDIEDMQEFAQTEQLETMTAHDAAQIKLTFGKFKGKTLKEIYKAQPDYLEWLLNQDRTDPVIKKGIELMFEAVKQQAQQKQEQQKVEQQEQRPVNGDLFEGEVIDISDDDLPYDM